MLLIKDGIEAENAWVFHDPTFPDALGDPGSREANTASDGKRSRVKPGTVGVCYTLGHFLANVGTKLNQNHPIGVRLEPADDPHDLTPYLDRIALIEISFPKYTDGRGYSQAQLLRRRLGYQGELRAVGHVLRDQILYMNRSGFDAYQTSRAALPEILEALAEYSAFYQPAADDHASVFARRHKKA